MVVLPEKPLILAYNQNKATLNISGSYQITNQYGILCSLIFIVFIVFIMGPKGKTKKSFQKTQLSIKVRLVLNMDTKLKAIDLELSEKTLTFERKHEELNALQLSITRMKVFIDALRVEDAHNLNVFSVLKQKVVNQKQEISRRNACLLQSNTALSSHINVKCPFFITNIKATKRKRNPFTDDLHPRSKVRRSHETFDACTLIHGGSEEEKKPVLKGMLDTICRKFKSTEVAKELLDSGVTAKLKANLVTTWHNSFYVSDENKLRSLSVYYSHNVMGKTKL